MDILGVTPNELLSGEWKYLNQAEKEVCQFLRTKECLNAELKHGHQGIYPAFEISKSIRPL